MNYRNPGFLADAKLLGWGTYWLARYAWELRCTSPSTILADIRALPPTGRGQAKREDLDKLWRWLRFIQTRIWRDHKPCLRRSLVLYRWCVLHGITAEVIIGVRRTPDGITGHAWLLLDGVPYQENENNLEQFTCLIQGQDP